MTNPHGTPIWYELLTPDHASAKRFYDAVVGWTIEDAPAGPIDYRMIRAGADNSGANAGGVMQITPEMASGGAQPGWLFYVGVDDVDATAAQVTANGGTVVMAPHDLPGVGRMAFVTDPQGAPFYIMRGASPEDSTAFAPGERGPRNGHCGWNELWTSNVDGALAFYRTMFGWENPSTMDMGPMGGYHFVHLPDDIVLGALAKAPQPGQPPRWAFYFWVSDVEAAMATAKAQGGTITAGPHDVPGGLRTVMGTDPHGATFALVGPGLANNGKDS